MDQNWVQIKAQICNAQFPGNNQLSERDRVVVNYA